MKIRSMFLNTRFHCLWVLILLIPGGRGLAQNDAEPPRVKIGDQVVLSSGRVIEGIILSETERELQIQTRSGKLTLPRAMIKSVVRGNATIEGEAAGDQFYANREYRRAIEVYRKGLEQNPTADEARRLRGKIQLCQQELERVFRQQFERELKQIEEHQQNHEYNQALILTRQIATDPRSSDVTRELMQVQIAKICCAKAVDLSDQIRDKEALQELDQAITECPAYYRSYLLKAQLHNRQGERTSETAGLYIAALERGAEELRSEDHEGLNLTIARILRDIGQASRALPYYLKVIELLGDEASPRREELVTETVETFEALAENYAQQDPQSIQQTIAGLQKAIALQPARFETRRLLSRIYMELKQYDEAIVELQNVIALRSGARGNYILLGQAYIERGDYARAEDALQTELRIDPDNYESRLHLSRIYIKQKKYSQAIQFGKDTLKIAPDYFAANEIIAEANFLNEDYLEAKIWFNKIIRQQPDNLEAQLRLAQIDLEQENLYKADEQFDQILEALARRHNTTVERMGELLTDEEKIVYAECKTSQGEIQLDSAGGDSPRSALIMHREAAAVLPKFAKAYNNMGDSYMAMEQYDKAEESMITARDLEPDNADYWFSLGSLYDQLKRPQEAIEHYKQFIIRGGKDWQTAAAKLQTLGLPVSEVPRSPLMKAGEEVEVVQLPPPEEQPASAEDFAADSTAEPSGADEATTAGQELITADEPSTKDEPTTGGAELLAADEATTDSLSPADGEASTSTQGLTNTD